jgi:hypothetical protein
MKFEGACLCGEITFHVDGAPKWVAYCHCTMCRRAHGAGSVAWVGVEKQRFHLDTSATLAQYNSSPPAKRSFCAKCGSPLFFESERWADEVHIALGVIKEPHDLKPRAHAFFDDRAQWVHVEDGLPRRGGPNGTTPL